MTSLPCPAPARIVGGLDLDKVYNGGAAFELDHDINGSSLENFDEELINEKEEDDSGYSDQNFFDYKTLRDQRVFPIDAPFEEMAQTMEFIDDEQFVKKQIIRPGRGNVVNYSASVEIHYQMFLDGIIEPFDSTRLRKKRFHFQLGDSGVIIGLQEAVSTMRVKELSRFFIMYQKAYGKKGILPRIPPEANIMVEVELLNAVDGCCDSEIADPSADQATEQFVRAMFLAKEAHLAGNDLFKAHRVKEAISKYQRAVKICEGVRLANGQEEAEMVERKVKLHVNLATCYNQLNKPQQACAQSRYALVLDPSCVKGLFNYGRGQLKLSNFTMAAEYLKRALKLSPGERSIQDELKQLEAKKRLFAENEKDFCKRFVHASNIK